MSSTSVVLLIGVCSFWVATIVFFALFLKLRNTLSSMEKTLDSMRDEIDQLSPVVADTLRQVTDTGKEVEETVSEAKNILRNAREHPGASVVGSAVTYLPILVSTFNLIRSIFSKRKKK